MFNLKPDQYVGYTCVIHQNDLGCPEGIFYCMEVEKLGYYMIFRHKTRPDCRWACDPNFVTRLRDGDYA